MKKENEKTEKVLDTLATFFDLTLKKFQEYEEEDAKEKEEKEKSKKDEKEEKEESKKDEKNTEKGLNISDFVNIILDELDEKYLRKKVKIELDDTNDSTESVVQKEKESKKEEEKIVDAEFKEVKEEPKKKEPQKVEKVKEENIETENKVKEEPKKDVAITPDENPVIDTSGLVTKENMDNFNSLFVSIRNTISEKMKDSKTSENFRNLKLLGVKFNKGVFVNGVFINTKNSSIFEVFNDGNGNTEFSDFKNIWDYKSRVYSRLNRASEMSKEEKEKYLSKFPKADWKLLKKEK